MHVFAIYYAKFVINCVFISCMMQICSCDATAVGFDAYILLLRFICRDSCKYNQKREKPGTLPCACTRQRNQMSSAVCLLTAKETRIDRLCCLAGDLAIGWSLCRVVIEGTRHTARLLAHDKVLTHGKLSTGHRR
jgi:hypothetical protein